MIDLIDIILIVTLFLLLSLPITYQITNKLTYSIFNIISSNGCPNINGIILHLFIFSIVIYFYINKIADTESFNLCDPGFKLSDPLKSYQNPSKSWCEYGTEKDNQELGNPKKKSCNENDNEDDDEDYYTDKKSWCSLKD